MVEVHLIRDGTSVTVTLGGELDYSVIEDCLAMMADVKSKPCQDYFVDLSGLTSIDSSGLGVLISIRNAAVKAGGALTIRGAKGAVAETLRLTRFDVLASIV